MTNVLFSSKMEINRQREIEVEIKILYEVMFMKKKVLFSLAAMFTALAVVFTVVPTVAHANVWHSRTATRTVVASFRNSANPNMNQAQLRSIWVGPVSLNYNSNGWSGTLNLNSITVLSAGSGSGNFSGTVSCLNVCMMP